MIDEAHRSQLQTQIMAAFDIADWIYHDTRFDLDNEAATRTADRLHKLHEAHGRQALYGIGGAWATKAYWRMQDAYLKLGRSSPTLTPGDMVESIPYDDERKRAYVSAQQFIAAIAASDYEMAEAIFNAAYDADIHDAVGLLYSVLLLSVAISSKALKMGKVSGR